MNYHNKYKNNKTKHNIKLLKLFRYAHNVLTIVKKSSSSISRGNHMRLSYPLSIESERRRSLNLAKELLNGELDPFELQSLASFMRILLPSSNDWYEIDKIICSIMNEQFINKFGLHSILMLSHLLSTVSQKYPYIMQNQFNSLEMIAKLITLPDGSIPLLGNSNKNEIMSIDNVNSTLEKCGLLVELLAQSPDLLNSQWKKNISLQLCDILDTVDNTIIEINNENKAKFSLKLVEPLWKNLSLLDLSEPFQIYKSLFKLCESIIESDVDNTYFDENTMLSLLEGLKISSFKFRDLIRLIFTRMFDYGIGNLSNGIQIFRALIELDEILLATELLNAKIEKDKVFLDKPDNRELSDVAKTRIYHLLSLSHHIRTAEIRLALVAFSKEPKHSKFYRKLIGIEELLIGEISRFNLEEVISIYLSYGHAVRLHVRVLEALDSVLLNNYASLSVSELGRLLFTCAKLNYKPHYINQIAQDMIIHYSKPVNCNVSSISAMIKALWSMAVLDILRYKHWEALHDKILPFRSSLHPFVDKQLETITAELQIRARLAAIKIKNKKDNLNINNENDEINNNNNYNRYDINEDKMVDFLESYSHGEQITSKKHLQVSKILKSFGIPHRNEVTIEYNYTVDILLTETSEKYPKGTVIEFDGPTHFETYLYQPDGSTELRRRHIRSLGYKLISIPFLQYGRQSTLKAKEKLLLNLINEK